MAWAWQAAGVNGRCHAARARTGLLGSIEVLLFCLLNAREERREKKYFDLVEILYVELLKCRFKKK